MTQQQEKSLRTFDTKEFQVPETYFVRNIENNVFQGITVQCLSKIDGISLLEGTFIDSLFGRAKVERISGIHIEQDSKNQSVSVKVEVNVCYGISIPEKAEEIQTKISDEITRITGLHVACVHVVFKDIVPGDQMKKLKEEIASKIATSPIKNSLEEEEYSDEF